MLEYSIRGYSISGGILYIKVEQLKDKNLLVYRDENQLPDDIMKPKRT